MLKTVQVGKFNFVSNIRTTITTLVLACIACSYECTPSVKKQDAILLSVSAANAYRFSKFFHW